MAALVIALVPTAAGGSPLGRADVPSLAEAHAEVLRSEQRLVDATAARDAARAELDDLTSKNADLVDRIATARSELRDRAVAAFVSTTPDESMLVLFGGDDLYDASAKTNMMAHAAEQSSEAVDRYNELKAEVDPRLVDAATRLQQLEQDVVDANDAVLAARANEAEAERQEELRRAEAAAEAARLARAAALAASKATSTTALPATAGGVAAMSTPEPAAPSAPLTSAPSGGPTESQWAALRKCESGGNYAAVSASGKYRGAYQFDTRTWAGLGSPGDPAAAAPAEQDARAKLLYSQRSWRPWPVCGRFLR